MSQIGAPLAGSYEYGEVARSILIAIVASYAALDLGGRVTAARGWVRAAWLTGGAIAMGIGIWAMHFKALMAFRLAINVGYHWPTVLASLVIGVLASAIALYVATRKKMGPVQAWTGSLIMGGGIAAMHYAGMAAMRMAAVTRFDHLRVALSVVLAILFSRIALMFTFDYREDFRGTTLAKIISAAVMGAAISLMHYSGMAAVSFMSAPVFPNLSHTVSVSPLANNGIAIVTFLVLGTAILTSSVDRQTQVEVRRLNERLEQRVVERTTQLTAANEGLHREIAERQRAEEERRRVETYLAMAQRMARMGVWSWNPSSGDMFGSEEFYRILGIDADKAKLTREVFLQRIHPEDLPRYESEVNAAVAERRNWELDYRIVLPDGSFKYLHAIGKPVFDKYGDILEFVGTTLDITERKRAEHELRQAEDHIRAILEYSPNWIFLKDTEGRYLLVNREIERVFGISQGQIKGKTDSEIFPPEQAAEYRANDLKVLRAGLTMEFEEIALLEDRPHTSMVHKFPLFDTHGNIYAIGGVATDITERVRAEEELRRLSGQLLRLQDEERRKIARDLHDSTGQDLVALATTLGQLQHSIPSSARRARKLFSMCRTLAERSIREIRTLSYLLHPPMLDEAGLVEALHHFAAGFAERTGIEVDLQVAPHFGRLNPDVELGLFRVVQESLTNIQRHSGSFTARIRLDRHPDKIILEVSDAGRGFTLSKHMQNKPVPLAAGVGIPSMQERAIQIGASLEIESSNHGTTVRVTIPLGGKRT
jgi:PAS domain S-box-containing protein